MEGGSGTHHLWPRLPRVRPRRPRRTRIRIPRCHGARSLRARSRPRPAARNRPRPVRNRPRPPHPASPPAAPPYTPPEPSPRPEDPGAPLSPGYGGQVPPGGWQRSPVPQTSNTGMQRAPTGQLGLAPRRLLIDGAVILVPAAILFFALLGGVSGAGDDGTAWSWRRSSASWRGCSRCSIVVLLYAPLLMKRPGEHNGQTWGKQLVGIRATRNNGQEWTFWFGSGARGGAEERGGVASPRSSSP